MHSNCGFDLFRFFQLFDQRRLPQINPSFPHSTTAFHNGGILNGFRDQEREYYERELQFEDELEVERY